ncbi:NAD-dependent epimerase/dehydratase family protein [Halopolyspora algeriensis]|uniref:NAD-dependent epimerase/dehydratase family protein n=1 Tax=Halopolyspora algeriensis TaxID=1500506 RepID=UPI00211F0B96|nr:NAD(P)-dependent oxidoreductase [Halopolyspora algeriensis]
MFVTGATGVVGRMLLPQLRGRGHHVTALVRRARDADRLGDVDGVAVADVMDLRTLRRVLIGASPDVVVHQVTGFRSTDCASGMQRTAHLRTAGTENLISAAVSAGAHRVVAQSAASAYFPHGHEVLDEEAPLWTDAPGRWGAAVRAVEAQEEALLTCPDIEGVALRYGALYGPDTSFAPAGRIHRMIRGSAVPLVEDGGGITSFTHVEDAAGAVLEVLADGESGAYNVVDNEPAQSSEWLPAYAHMIGGPAPVSLTREQAREQLHWLTVHQLTEQRGATNFRLREAVGWRPVWPSWREGFADLFGLWPG